MLRAGLGQAECIDTMNATRLAIEQCKSGLGGLNPQAGIVFAGDDFDHRKMLDDICRSFPGIELIGCTTAGEFSSGFGFSDDSVALMVFHSDDIRICAGLGRNVSEYPEAAIRSAIVQAREGLSGKESLCLIFPAGQIRFPDMIIDTLNRELDPGCPIFGGMAGHQLEDKFRQFFKTEVLEDSAPLLLFSGPLEYSFSVSNSWRPVGRRSRITESRGNTAMRIGDMKALDFYRYYLGSRTSPNVEFPLAVYEADGAHFFIRAVLGYNETEGSVTFLGNIPEGAVIQLTEVIRDNILEDTVRAAERSNRNYSKGRPGFALALSCALRKYILGTRTREELELIRKHIGPDIPVIGFYTFGEFSPLIRDRQSRFHNATLVTLLIGPGPDEPDEKETVIPLKPESPEKEICPYDLMRVNQFLRKKLGRSEVYREQLEMNKELSSALLRNINHEIEEARQEVQDANQKIMDSLHYAKMIQQSLLPNPEEVKQHLPRSFIIWRPKDVVGGDIFFVDAYRCSGILIAVIDCTGHGVPGAFMTMIASSGLTRIIRDERCYDPADILKRLNFIIRTTLRQDREDTLSDDGLDAGICFIPEQIRNPKSEIQNTKQPNTKHKTTKHQTTKHLIFAGARLPLFCFYENELKMIKGDRQSIGYKKSDPDYKFTNHTVMIEKGMRFYLATDGFTDQLGGKRGRRFGTSRFKKLLKNVGKKPFDEQKESLIRAFEEYRGDNESQDDVTVMGFEV